MGKWIFEKIRIYIDCLLEVIFPIPLICNGCGRELKEQNTYKLCDDCFSKVSFSCGQKKLEAGNNQREVAYDDFFVACKYEGLTRELVHKIKYRDKREIAITVAAIIAEGIRAENYEKKYDFIVPVPISNKKLKKRGYNHVKLIAMELVQYTNVPILDCLVRTRDTEPQVLFNVHERWYNVKGCFKFNGSKTILGKTILLVDDIITTGATVHYCAEELKAAGAKSVIVFSFAKSNLL